MVDKIAENYYMHRLYSEYGKEIPGRVFFFFKKTYCIIVTVI